ncbi:hypothetical protein SAMN04490189_0043 [Pseudomonas koreensis]|uniref:immunity protein Imm33 domain-containing protein n=1 Tax=Pseudomonas koreensis TaxID=198620 RepID=UPI00087A7F88|nr:hypothetical protein [Pseudomonas koreensis]KAB0514176.1 hypothetical protein F7R05_07915 [Pseudomonas koreensis]NNA62613.1 hypothetical protein [Pseudomonas koreensis]GGK48068.1 hypothetical protein GCM10009103_48240 [Pseudomonas koreensis]SDC60258.1 hypothetical protein SAMN04490189_0043 [Pseudomonas koreensis]
MQKAEPVYPDDLQKKVCEQYGLPVLPPEEMVAVAIGSLGKSPIYGTRVQLPEGGNVSWFIHCGDYSATDDFYQAVHIQHLSEMLPQVVNYLCLPTGAKFIIDTEGYEDVWMAE